jgi:outer membrane lipoprotein-sorting protein
MTLTGKMEAGTKDNVQLPFVLKLKRPKMSRLELQFGGKTALQIYDGQNGWKVRPFLGRNEVEPFTAAELEKAGEEEQMEGPLIDHEAKGIQVELDGVEPVEGHDAYKLKLTMKNGKSHHLWVDAQSFLEVKAEGSPRTLDGKPHNVEVYYRNYKPAGSLRVPYLLETVVAGVKQTHKITIDSYVLNSKLEDSAFAKPDLPGGIVPAAAPRGTAQHLPTDATKKGGQNDKNR